MPIPIGAAMLGGAGLNFLGGLASKAPEQFPTYSAPGIPEQGAFIQQLMRSMQRGDGDFGFAQAAQSGNSTLQQMMRDRGMPGVTGEGAGGSLFAQMLSQAMSQDVAGRRQFGLAAAQAQPWVFNYQKRGKSPYGDSGWAGRSNGNSGLRTFSGGTNDDTFMIG